MAARLVLALATVLITYWISETLTYENPYTLLGAFLMSLFITCYFVDIHIDVS